MKPEAEHSGLSTEELFRLYRQQPSDELKWEIVMRHTGLIRSIALQIRGVYCSFTQLEDVIDEGLIELSKAVDKYNPDKGRFDTFVAKRIRGMIIDMARQQDWIPRPVRQKAKEIDRVTGELYRSLGRFPTDHEVAQYMDISDQEYQDYLSKASMHSVISLEEMLEGYDQGVQGESNDASDAQPEQAVERQELLSALAAAIGTLRENEQTVLSLYYQKDMKMKDIADVLNVSYARVSQIHARAIQKLKAILSEH